MQIIFTRTGEFKYSTQAVRDDGVTVRIPGFDHVRWLPHDLAHYVVEYELGLQDGFWGCVAAGLLCSGMQIVEGRQKPHAKERSQAVLKQAGQRTNEAEGLVAIMMDIAQRGQHYQASPMQQALMKNVWQPRHPLQSLEVRRVCTELCDYHQQWQALAIGQNLEVTWRTAKTGKATRLAK